MATATLTATVSAPAVTVEMLSGMSRDSLGKMFRARFGFDMPKGWNRKEGATAYMGTAFKKGTNGKACAQWHYTAKVGVAPTKSWSVAKLTTEVASDTPKLPGGKTAKADAANAYILKTGYLPAKSWTLALILEKTATGTLPARNAVKASAEVLASLAA